MLGKSDNEILCRVGPGTPMGELIRQYWIPALPSFELPSADCPPKRVRLLGEDLVAYRDTEGRVGMLKEACPHRGASMFFGRNEEGGLRCVYHGWKFDVSGACVDMPSEPAESNFKNKVHAGAYPCNDVNHMIWVYMGPSAEPPEFPPFEINTLPEDHVLPPMIMMEEANWFQNLEGDIDSAHIDYLHSRLTKDAVTPGIQGFFSRDRAPHLEVIPTDYGAFYTGKREWDDDGNIWHRVSQYIFPIHTMIAASRPDMVHLRSFIPLDDHYTMLVSHAANVERPVTDEERMRAMDGFRLSGGYEPATSDPRSRYFTTANKSNDYLIDYEVQNTIQYTGIAFSGNLQDRAMTELMANEEGTEPIYDRSKEHLGTTDAMVIAVRRMLLRAARRLRDEGVPPANVADPSLGRVRSASAILAPTADWIASTEDARKVDSPTPISAVPST